ncbi:DNA replication protein [Leuconostoc citreum]|uniref:conserved phage C-terminal domain-containing protein n=1 Tax=Leuconostoc citreum TaxID=33964 RepID=UPI0021A937EE|nr:conserved phage C-terminal domain-containing protein [Leuconostoc citreum]MCT3059067.1 DNA replication protein [Leuconostoc citreum]
MAQRRMFSKKVTDTDTFLDMPLSTQALYFHLNMHADDDGFIDNTKTIQRMIGSSDDDRKLLVAKQFIIPFENGLVVIKDWRVHNYIQGDRYHKTQYINEKSQLVVEENNMYTKRVQDVSNMDTQVRLGKDRLGKDSKDILSGSDEPDHVPYKEIVDYLNEKANTKYRSSGSKTKLLIKARVNDGFDLDDFKKVIDTKASQWLNDPKMKKFLRPETLFGTKFEGYLNEVGVTQPTKKDYSQMTREQQLIEVMGKDGVRF